LLGIAEHLDDSAALGITALYLTPVFGLCLEPPLPNLRLRERGPPSRATTRLRELLDAATPAACASSRRRLNHASAAFWPFHHSWRRHALALPRLGPPGRRRPGWPPRPHGLPGHADTNARLGLNRACGACPALPKLNHSKPGVREYIYGIAERWLRFGHHGWAPGRAERSTRPASGRSSAPLSGGELGCVSGGRDPGTRAPEWLLGGPAKAAAGRFQRPDNYPWPRRSYRRRRGPLDEELVGKTHEYGRNVRRSTDRSSAAARTSHDDLSEPG